MACFLKTSRSSELRRHRANLKFSKKKQFASVDIPRAFEISPTVRYMTCLLVCCIIVQQSVVLFMPVLFLVIRPKVIIPLFFTFSIYVDNGITFIYRHIPHLYQGEYQDREAVPAE